MRKSLARRSSRKVLNNWIAVNSPPDAELSPVGGGLIKWVDRGGGWC